MKLSMKWGVTLGQRSGAHLGVLDRLGLTQEDVRLAISEYPELLKDDERMILDMRLGLTVGTSLTLKAIAERITATGRRVGVDRVRQIQNMGLFKIRRKLGKEPPIWKSEEQMLAAVYPSRL